MSFSAYERWSLFMSSLFVSFQQLGTIMSIEMISLKLFLLSIAVPIVYSNTVEQHLDCQGKTGLFQQSNEVLQAIRGQCIDFVLSSFTTIDKDEPEFSEIVQLCACELIRKGVIDLNLIDKESLWNSLKEDLFSEKDNVEKQSVDHLDEDELEAYFENLIESQEDVEEDEEDLQSSGSTDPQHEEQLVDSIQFGISNSLGELLSKPIKVLESKDFSTTEEKSLTLPPTNRYQKSDFRFETYAPCAFYHLRKIYGIESIDLFESIGNQDTRMTRFGNPGASGSGFFRTHDDKFFIKTEQSNEAELLIKILKSYYKNFESNPRSLLPKFVGQYAYHGPHVKKVHLLAMNNLLPSSVKMDYKYDLKGSTYNRKASAKERAKSSPTFKDLDFREQNAEGFFVEPEIYDALIETLKKDVKFLKTFNSMDYSLLLGVHKVDSDIDLALVGRTTVESLNRTNRFGPILALDSEGQKVLLYIGIIDVLQDYRLSKRIESHWKTVFQAQNISVKHPSFYAQRFYDFISKIVLRRA